MPETERLLLRGWRDADLGSFAALNADPEVMAHFPSILDRAESDAMVDRIVDRMQQRGFGLWAVEVIGGPTCIGFVGLNPIPFEAAFTPALEVGWRLARSAWGRGYAPEGAREALRFGFDELGLDQIVSFTYVGNENSRRVMEKIGMHRNPADDFDHPTLLETAPHVARHVLYRVSRDEWLAIHRGGDDRRP